MKKEKSKKTNSKFRDHLEKNFFDLLGEIYRDFKKELPSKLAAARDIIKIKLIEAQKKLSGETVVIIGPPEAGKTTLLRVLQDPNIDPELVKTYEKTEHTTQQSFKVRWKQPISDTQQINFTFKVRKTADVGGEQYVKENYWGKAITDAAFILYVVDAKRLISNHGPSREAYKKRILEDFDWLLINSQKPRANFSLVIVVNKIDLLCDTATYQEFESKHKPMLDELLASARNCLKPALRNNIRSCVLLSLTDPRLRQFTLDNVILGFIGENLLELYAKRGKAAA